MNNLQDFIKAQREIEAKAIKAPWLPCHHLQSIEKDNSCPCGYRGGVWGNDTVLFEMGQTPDKDPEDGKPFIWHKPLSQDEKIDTAQFVIHARNNYAKLLNALEKAIEQRDFEFPIDNSPIGRRFKQYREDYNQEIMELLND